MKITPRPKRQNHTAHGLFSIVHVLGLCLTVSLFQMGSVHAQTASQGQGSLGIAAVVNDDVVSMLDLNSRISMVIESAELPNNAETRAKISHQVLRGLIDEKLQVQEARRENITISKSQIDMAETSIAANNKMSLEDLSVHLQSIGASIATLSMRVEAELAWSGYLQRRLARSILIGAGEIDDEIERIQANAGRPEYLLAEIYLPVESLEQEDKVLAIAERLLVQMRQGAPFSALAKNFSRSPSAALGGDMGWVQYTNLDTTLQQTVTKMKPGTASYPVRALGGYYILLLRDVRTSPGLGGGDALIKLSQYHIQAPKDSDDAALNALGAQLEAATRHLVGCAQLEAASKQSNSLMSGSLGTMKLSTLSDKMKDVLSPLKVGQPSTAVATGGGVAVMMICERTDETVDMEKVREEIREKLKKKRLDIAGERKLRDLRRDAFVDIRL
ncbi:peptidylprolyl isomerase [Magnetovibrio blakemorei]|nr:peptidylprolyl isomerase [Magnetovibrio blakemorei]